MTQHLSPERLRSLLEGDPSDDEASHLLECAACRRAVEGDDLLAALGDVPGLNPLAEARVERRLLAALPSRRARAWQLGGVAAVALAAATWAVWPRSSPPPAATSHATIEVAEGSRVEPLTQSSDELLELEGEAFFRVRHLPQGHRFRVRVRADEIEVKGTAFRLKSDAEGLTSVEVTEGAVEVRSVCCGTHLIAAGQTWLRPAPTALQAPPAPAPSAPAPSPPALSHTISPGEPAIDLMKRGMASFDAGQFSLAASQLDQATALDPRASWARDARVLAGAARAMSAPVEAVANLSVGVASLDKAAQQAARRGDARRASAAALGAARQSKGEQRSSRFCALQNDTSLAASARAEASRECSKKP